MKTKFIHFAILLMILFQIPGNCQVENNFNTGKSNTGFQDSTKHSFNKPPGKFFWTEINAGYSTNGAAGSFVMSYRTGKLIFGTGYYKSHSCYKDGKERKYFLDIEESENHKSVESIHIFTGIVFPGKLNPSLTIGVSWIQFHYVNTIHIEHNVTLSRILATIANSDYSAEKLGSRTLNKIGVPVGIKLHFKSKNFVGFDAGLKADLNMHNTFVSAELGIRFGRIIAKH